MKATKDFVIVVNKKEKVRVPYKEGYDKTGLEFIKVKKGSEVPEDFLREIAIKNVELLDVKYVDKVPQLPKSLGITPPPFSKKMEIKKRKYTKDLLNQIYDKDGFSALKKVGLEFDPPVTDRSSRKLINEILRAQEERQRKGL